MIPTTPQTPAPAIAIQPVKSSSLDGYGYSSARRTLAVKFRGGKTYQYKNVPPEVFASLQKAESAGSFVSKNVVGKFEVLKPQKA